ncbi:MAG TPA: phosphoribosylanthranilate isomerase [Acetobacteraceae bacterium]|nr:phosphoribosylanthranilate isomerase [Acetobacteraceae bacterium]
MNTRVKICGLNSALAFDAAIAADADWVGFVFFPPSPRYVTPAEAGLLSARLLGGPPRVGLFVEPTLAAIGEVLAQVRLDVVQVYGNVDAAAIRLRFGVQVWRAVGVSSGPDLPSTLDRADALLLDAKPPKDATRPGGNAQSFDWAILRGWPAPGPWLLAGGLTSGNVAEAVRVSGALAVDVSSGVETAPGVKDPALIHQFVKAVRAAT